MKKIFLMVAVMIAAVSASFAQDFTFGARIGMNVANIGGDGDKLEPKIGLKAGVVGCFPLVDNVYLEVGAFYAPKGAKNSESNTIMGVKVNQDYTVKLNYIEIPICGVYKYEISSNFAVRGHFGPYFGVGLFGNEKLEINGSTKNSEAGLAGYKLKAFSSKSDECNYKRFDVGLNVGAGIEFSACYLGVQYGAGLSNFNSKNNKDYKMHNNVFSVDFGFNF
ncbi:MAG: outer membrane beta-barrel protein [Bacteroidales bacterium]|nr:outer membrane beta-barrel protein [Bacteroidales bacterium]